MAKLTKAQREWQPGMPKKRRSTKVLFASTVLLLEAFFGAEKALDAGLVQEAFASVTSPGRLEVVRTAPTIIVDAAHNPEGIRVSAEAIHEAFSFTKLVVVVGVLREKDAEEILRQLKESLGDLAAEYCFTQSNSPRAVPAEDLAEIALELGFGEDNIHVAEKLDDALEWAVERAEANDDLAGGVLVTGSITLVAEARILLGKADA
jgi:dihydrofolate synthase/folylpolyglutamate synthase